MKVYLRRCLDLAQRGGPAVAPNPMVGCVIVYNDTIIGEGWHRVYGGAHAEVEAVRSVTEPALLPESTLYVNLEPCNHTGKTPPCTDLIIQVGIRRVVVGCLDPNPKVAGSGIQRLREAGIEVLLASDPEPFRRLNRFFFLNQAAKRPFVLLKWAETPNGFIGRKAGERALLSCTEANRYVHSLRSTYQAILVGRTTARLDDPRLSVRLYPGTAPIRLVFDYDCNLSPELNLFSGTAPLILINHKRDEAVSETVRYFKPQRKEAFMDLKVLLEEIYERFSIGSVLVEGGRYVLQQFINQHLFDEIQVIRTPDILPELDVPAPVLPYQFYFDSYSTLGRDLLLTRTNTLTA